MSAPSQLDIAANRKDAKYGRGEMVRRLLWGATRPLFTFSPRPCFAWRRMILRLFGAKIGRQVHVYGSAVIRMPWNLEVGDWSAIGEEALIYNLGKVKIGEGVTISHRAHVCAGTHDHSDPAMPLLKPPITIGSDAWICTEAFVGPGVTVGQGAVVGARAVAIKDVEPWSIVAGNPARSIGKRELMAQRGIV